MRGRLTPQNCFVHQSIFSDKVVQRNFQDTPDSQSGFQDTPCELQYESQSRNRKKNESAQNAGFPPIPERALQSVQKPHLLCKRCCSLLGALSGIAGNPAFRADSFFGVFRLLWLVLRFTRRVLKSCAVSLGILKKLGVQKSTTSSTKRPSSINKSF